QVLMLKDNRYQKRSFISGHQSRGNNNPMKGKVRTRELNTNWKGGRCKDKNGYIKIRNPYKKYDDKKEIFDHRAIYQYYLSILFDEVIIIPNGYEIHHINEIKDDNRLINLTCLSHREHRQLHMMNNTFSRKI